tara:strand:- start:1889 stop:2398 length:510 start_codon:yes stop_codon:yes gene_type:complete
MSKKSKKIETPPAEPVNDPYLEGGYIKPVKIVDPVTGEIFIDYTGIGTRENAEKYDELQEIPVEKFMGGEISKLLKTGKIKKVEPNTKVSSSSGKFKFTKKVDSPNSVVKIFGGSSKKPSFGDIEGIQVVKKMQSFPMETFSTGGEVKGKKKKNSIDGCAIKGYTKGRR